MCKLGEEINAVTSAQVNLMDVGCIDWT